MLTLAQRFEDVILDVLSKEPPSPEMLAYFDHIRVYAELSSRAGESAQAFEQWQACANDNRAWLALSEAERATFRSYL